MKKNTHTNVKNTLNASEYMKLVTEAPKDLMSKIEEGVLITIDKDAKEKLHTFLESLPEKQVTQLKKYASEIKKNFEAKGEADFQEALNYGVKLQDEGLLKGLGLPLKGSTPDSDDKPTSRAIEWGIVVGILFVILAVIVVVAGVIIVLKAIDDALKRGGAFGPFVIHGPNDPNGPIDPPTRPDPIG